LAKVVYKAHARVKIYVFAYDCFGLSGSLRCSASSNRGNGQKKYDLLLFIF
jgi:hypothetical protein